MNNKEKSTPSYYAVIPADVRYNKKIPPNARLLYGEITALCNKEGYCWAENRYFAELYGVRIETISRWISALKSFGYVRTEGNKFYQEDSHNWSEQRKIYINDLRCLDKKIKGSCEKDQENLTKRSRELDKKINHNITSNITKNNTLNKGSLKDLPEALSLDLCNTQEISFRNTGSSFAAPNKDSEKEKTEVPATVQSDGLTEQSNDESLERLAKAAQSLTKNFDTRPYVALEERPDFNLNDPKSLQNFENLKWLRRNRDHMHYYCKWAYETTQPSICEFIYEANELYIPIEYSKRTYELWNERGWTFAESGDPIKHWVGALKKFYQKRKHEKEHAHESYNTCEVCGAKYHSPVLDYQPEEWDEPVCSSCNSKIPFQVILPEEDEK